MKTLLSAFAFLTILPVPVAWLDPHQNYRDCVKLFPVVGAFLGMMVAAASWALMKTLPDPPAAVLIVTLMISVSGALHLDGLADTADGFLSGRPRERVLEIMRDSRIGTMGVAAILLVTLLKVTLVYELLRTEETTGISAIATAVFLGRCSFMGSMRMNDCARTEGLGNTFWYRSTTASILWLIVACLAAYGLIGTAGVVGVGLSVILISWLSVWSDRQIGGATGDTAGAGCELTEASFLLGVVMTQHWGAV